MENAGLRHRRRRHICLVDMLFGSHFYNIVTKIIFYFFVYCFAWGCFMGIWTFTMRNHIESGQIQLFSFSFKMRINGSLDTSTELALVDQYTNLAHLFFMRVGSKSTNDTEKEKIPEDTTPTPDVKYRSLLQRQKIRERNEDKREAETSKAGVTHREASSDDGNMTTGVVNGKTGTVKLADIGFAVYKEPSNVTAIKCLAKASKRPTASALLKHPSNEKVQSCTFPDAMKLVYDLQLRQFIERCVKPLCERPTASEFLKHPCLSTNDEGGERSQDNRPNPSRLGSLRKLSSTRKS